MKGVAREEKKGAPTWQGLLERWLSCAKGRDSRLSAWHDLQAVANTGIKGDEYEINRLPPAEEEGPGD